MVAAHVEIEAGGAAAHADDAQVPRLFGPQNAGVFQAVAGGIGGLRSARPGRRNSRSNCVQRVAQRVELRRRPSRGARRRRRPCRAAGGCRSSSSFRRSTLSLSRLACALAMTKPTSVAIAPMSAM